MSFTHQASIGAASAESTSRRSLRHTRILLGGVALLAMLTAAFLAAPRLTPDEQRMIGRWYGYFRDDARGENYAWLDDYHRDGTMRVVFRTFYPDGQEGAWISEDYVEVGDWSCENGHLREFRWGEHERPSWLQRCMMLLQFGSWPTLAPFTPEYDVRSQTPLDLSYTSRDEGRTYHAMRVDEDFELPEQPTTVAAMRARLEGSRVRAERPK